MLITAELELELPDLISLYDQPELFNFPLSEPFEMKEIFLEPLHHANSVLQIFSPVTAHQSDFLANVGVVVGGYNL